MLACAEVFVCCIDSLLVLVVLGVGDTGTARGHLDVAPLHRLDVTHVVLVGQFAGDNVREDLGFAVRVSRESLTGLDRASVLTYTCGRIDLPRRGPR